MPQFKMWQSKQNNNIGDTSIGTYLHTRARTKLNQAGVFIVWSNLERKEAAGGSIKTNGAPESIFNNNIAQTWSRWGKYPVNGHIRNKEYSSRPFIWVIKIAVHWHKPCGEVNVHSSTGCVGKQKSCKSMAYTAGGVPSEDTYVCSTMLDINF